MTETNPDRDFNYLKFLENNVRDGARDTASYLRQVADEIDRIANNREVDKIAQEVTHKLVWGVANSNVDGIAYRYNDYLQVKQMVEAEKRQAEATATVYPDPS
ncbi:hypothetical protein SEA_SKOG_53 [Gordonia phage Skog]|uniref:Uncharacterized protein n=1 Tax=Gordonia phage Skog TaxID=2704033 RepID=A0A6G6XK29_9CAUD|nr:hypothetical protein KHQ85_gp053 [Gordonia phage Skog]QIG58205.1 hypothetical protein SEA_SKOG_53 [Gordonia phage Skog]